MQELRSVELAGRGLYLGGHTWLQMIFKVT